MALPKSAIRDGQAVSNSANFLSGIGQWRGELPSRQIRQ